MARVIPSLISPERCDALIASGLEIAIHPLPICVPMPHRLLQEFLDQMRDWRTVELARELIGPCDGLGSDYFFHPAGSPGRAVHCDNDYVDAPDGTLASIWIALVDAHSMNGCLYTSDGDIVLAKGDAVMLAQNEPHGSNPNRTQACRHALLLTYLAHGASFRPGNTQNRKRVPLC